MSDEAQSESAEGAKTVSNSSAGVPAVVRSGVGATRLIIGLLAISTVLSLLLFSNYTRFQRYVRDTLEFPETPLLWEIEALAPEQCIDLALEWASDCHGVKGMCDEYVPRIIRECLGSQDRLTYCDALGESTRRATFGHAECAARGVQRNVDGEACGSAYRTIDDYCSELQDRIERGVEPGYESGSESEASL